MSETCINVEVVTGTSNEVVVCSDNQVEVTGNVSSIVTTDVEASNGEAPYKTQAVTVAGPVSEVTHDKLARPIHPIIWVDGAPLRWAKLGITQDTDNNKLVFPEGMAVYEDLIFDWK